MIGFGIVFEEGAAALGSTGEPTCWSPVGTSLLPDSFFSLRPMFLADSFLAIYALFTSMYFCLTVLTLFFVFKDGCFFKCRLPIAGAPIMLPVPAGLSMTEAENLVKVVLSLIGSGTLLSDELAGSKTGFSFWVDSLGPYCSSS